MDIPDHINYDAYLYYWCDAGMYIQYIDWEYLWDVITNKK